jgi:spoIIIJ-associated protein
METENIVEITADTVEDAIAQGLARLNAKPFEVTVDVLDEPNAGIFGMGARPARVRLERISRAPSTPYTSTSISAPIYETTTISLPTYVEEPPAPEPAPRPPRRERAREAGPREGGRTGGESRGDARPGSRGPGRGLGEGERRREARRPDERPAPPPPRGVRADVGDGQPAFFDFEPDDDRESASFFAESIEVPEADHDEEAAVAKVVLNELLERMELHVPIVVRRSPPDDKDNSTPWILDITLSDTMRLVGRQGETLQSLQYIARLITSREMQKRATFIVDVNSYKAKRARKLHNLAMRMADEAVERQRTVILEPMPPHERRIIHMALRTREDVATRSQGEGDNRKVTIVPRQADGG